MVEESKACVVDQQQALQVLAEQGITVDTEYFNNNGVGIVRNFASATECKSMMDRMAELVEGWDPSASVEFRTDNDQEKN